MSGDNKVFKDGFIIGMLLGGAAVGVIVSMIALFATAIAETHGNRQVRIEAVEAGHAEWVAQPDGSTDFRWLPVEGQP